MGGIEVERSYQKGDRACNDPLEFSHFMILLDACIYWSIVMTINKAISFQHGLMPILLGYPRKPVRGELASAVSRTGPMPAR